MACAGLSLKQRTLCAAFLASNGEHCGIMFELDHVEIVARAKRARL
jgi:hypothetical protein